MKLLCQVGVIFGVCWISQILASLLPYPFPARVIGMWLLFILLATGGLKLEHVR